VHAEAARATGNHKPGIPHPIFNPRNYPYRDNYDWNPLYLEFIRSCIPLPTAWLECDEPLKSGHHT
jgi:hypothetical protein